MANEEHLKILRSGVEKWNKWREENPDVMPDLKKANLTKVSLSGVDLRLADLSGADLSGAYLRAPHVETDHADILLQMFPQQLRDLPRRIVLRIQRQRKSFRSESPGGKTEMSLLFPDHGANRPLTGT